MKAIRKTGAGFLAVILTAILILGIRIPVRAEEEYPAKIVPAAVTADYTRKVVILHSNDVHGAIDGYPKMAELKTTYEEMGAEVLLVDAGDFMQGDPYVKTSQGKAAVDLMNAVGYQIAVPGNHEMDYGVDVFLSNLDPEKDSFQMICANLRYKDKQMFSSNTMYHAKNGIDIGFVGIATPETKTKSNPVRTKDLSLDGGQDMADIATEQARELKEEGAESVIALAHLGVDEESGIEQNRSTDLYHNSEGLDFVLDGHSHTVMTSGMDGEPIQSTGTKFAYIGALVLDDKGTVEDHYLIDTTNLASDAKIEAEVQEIKDDVDRKYAEVIGESEVELDGSKEGNRGKETNNGDLTTDSMLWYAEQEPEILGGFTGPVIGIMNGGALRDKIPQGDVTKKDILNVHPFGDTLNIVFVKGADLLEALEASTFITPEPVGGYPQTAGIQFTIDTTKPYDAGELYPGSTYHRPKTIQRVSIQSLNGQPFDPEATIAVVTNTFVALGGDTYYVFSQYQSEETGIPLEDNLAAYIESDQGLKGIITKEKYGTSRGDQVQLPHVIEKVEAKAATLKEEGWKEYYRCTVCEKLFSDSEGKQEIPKESVIIPKLINIGKADVSAIAAQTYTGKAHKPAVTVSCEGSRLKKDRDYKLSYESNINVGTAKVTITGIGKYGGTKKTSFTIKQAKNSITKVAPASKSLKAGTLKNKSQTFQLKAADKFGAKKVFALHSGTSSKAKKYITVTKAGKVTVKKGTPKGTYTAKVKVSAAGTKNYKAAAATKSIKITVK